LPGAGRVLLGPAGSHPVEGKTTRIDMAARAITTAADAPQRELPADDFFPAVSFTQRFTLRHSPEAVFYILGTPAELAACLPGGVLIGRPVPDRLEGELRVKMGPITAAFRGIARLERHVQTLSGRIIGSGSDARSRSSTRGEIGYRLTPIEDGS